MCVVVNPDCGYDKTGRCPVTSGHSDSVTRGCEGRDRASRTTPLRVLFIVHNACQTRMNTARFETIERSLAIRHSVYTASQPKHQLTRIPERTYLLKRCSSPGTSQLNVLDCTITPLAIAHSPEPRPKASQCGQFQEHHYHCPNIRDIFIHLSKHASIRLGNAALRQRQ
ncbi:hypothetical protein BU16DRAFT_614315 [Lophium mytilinum]|uniref:Uncharacterized protein n=1 Tax=Lophium mytilinum TaxID=390894 RepID=A0A6A6R705_9PEZI|nr:hypothetical protein BU16DRAFT_614315 [Lophium mytilinum]